MESSQPAAQNPSEIHWTVSRYFGLCAVTLMLVVCAATADCNDCNTITYWGEAQCADPRLCRSSLTVARTLLPRQAQPLPWHHRSQGESSNGPGTEMGQGHPAHCQTG